MDISPANAARFKDVAQFLAEGFQKAQDALILGGRGSFTLRRG